MSGFAGNGDHRRIKKNQKILMFSELMLNKMDQDKEDWGYVQVSGVAHDSTCPNLLLNAKC
jgi:hypothetical protein